MSSKGNETIFLNQFNTSCLCHYSYYVESDKEAIVVDPVTDISPYLEQLKTNKAKLKYILNTHVNTDYVTGAYDLAIRTGATLIYGPHMSLKVNNRKVSKSEFERVFIPPKIEELDEEENLDNDDKENNNNNLIPTTEELEKPLNSINEEINYSESLNDYLEMFNLHIKILENQEKLKIGKIEIVLLHTPGHSIESSCYLIIDGNGKTNCVFTGDTLLIGDVGRPDMALVYQRQDKYVQKKLAKKLFYSIQLLKQTLPEDLVIYPTHSQGSPVAKHIIKGQSTSMKQELEHNEFVKETSLEGFIERLSNDAYVIPEYFYNIARLNLNFFTGKNFDYRLSFAYKPIQVQELVNKLIDNRTEHSVVVLDTRFPFTDFDEGYIPNSYIISLKAPFSIWTGFLLNPSDPIVVVCNQDKEKEAICRLMRIGFNNILGYLDGGFKSYKDKINFICEKMNLKEEDRISLLPMKFNLLKEKEGINYVYNNDKTILDVREKLDHDNGTFPNSILCPLSQLKSNIEELEKYKNKELYILCNTGIRASMAYSILTQFGFEKLFVLEGGIKRIKDRGVKV